MKLSKIALLLVLGGIGAQAFAADAPASPEVEVYNYATQLDIAHVISISDTSEQCGVVPAQMTYDDSNGARHVVQYLVMGSGCSNG
ncbi:MULTISPECIES: DUF2790 domain-containing protein [Pseudomonas]|uniref:DUF2790 domain-containing protein n=2 Tax=Pseudomonas TaxID=286 RepID=A0AA94ES92_9PSED|nr:MULTISPECIES: DUF2790 domain-containing protein [Pseudomonas]RVD79491.1 hypothetical protein A9HBioS_0015 [Pseudomonas koreensis]WDR35405.1 DUF2790 domain-containing protein [Pseudomonas serboccidentalis]